jgi:hypothetical protein
MLTSQAGDLIAAGCTDAVIIESFGPYGKREACDR